MQSGIGRAMKATRLSRLCNCKTARLRSFGALLRTRYKCHLITLDRALSRDAFQPYNGTFAFESQNWE
jgi:hypothetical protein